MNIRISVIIATRNRANYLKKVIGSLAHQTVPSMEYEIIVVDNDSHDNTKSVLEEFSYLENLRVIFEPVIGLSKSRNSGWKSAKGEYIAFIDDDAVANPNWLEKYIEAFDQLGDNIGLIGGRVELIWEAPKPDWLPTELLGIFSSYHYSDNPVALKKDQWLSACNLAIRKQLLSAAHGFREDLGRKGSTLLASEESYLRNQIDKWDLLSYYYPDIIVHHHVNVNKLTKKWFQNAAYWQGKSQAIILNPTGQPLKLAEKVKLSVKRALWITPRVFLMLFTTNSANRYRRWFQLIETTGYVVGLFSTSD